MAKLELTPDDMRPLDPDVRARLAMRIPQPEDFRRELRDILLELHRMADKLSRLFPRIRDAANAIADPGPGSVKSGDIVRIVARHFDVAHLDVLSHRRTMSVVRPRHVAMYLCRTQTALSLAEIGSLFNRRDHTTVLHAIRAIEHLMSVDTQFSQDIEMLKNKILIGEAE